MVVQLRQQTDPDATMDFLIRLLGERIARHIENGSTLGAFVGAMLGLAAGVGIVAALNAAGQFDDYRYAMFILLGVSMMIVGALLGARVGPAPEPVDGRLGFRLTNYNRAGGPLVVAVLMTGLLVATVVAPDQPTPAKPQAPPSARDQLFLYAVFPVVLLAAVVWSCTIVWSVTLGSDGISIRRLLFARRYRPRSLTEWGFVANGRPVGREPFGGTGELHMLFDDGRRVVMPVHGGRSAAVVQALALYGVVAARG
jgi:hypothetical protein